MKQKYIINYTPRRGYNMKYNIEKLLDALLIILTKGISYRDVQQFTPIHWNTIYSSLRERICSKGV